jgi:vanillate O-demethylase monooxygenase subunit
MYHGLLYAPDGRVTEIPGQDVVPPQAKVRSYAVVERHSWVWVWMGRPEQADEALIPPAVGFDNPDWILGRGYLDYDSEARLISDNLTDFSHLTYVHAASFQAGDTFAYSTPRVSPLSRGVRVERWVTTATNSAIFKDRDQSESFMSYDYLLPGVLLMWSGQFAKGTAERLNFEAPQLSDAISGLSFTSQAVTPTVDQTARYFFSWGPYAAHGDEAMRDNMMVLAAQAFAEDKLMIEAQQKIINATPNPVIMPIVHDKGVTLFNRLVERMCNEELGL